MKALSGSLLEPLWPTVLAQFEAARAIAAESGLVDEAASPVGATEAGQAPDLRRLVADWRIPTLPAYDGSPELVADALDTDSQALEYLWAGRTARAVGTVVHRHLQRFSSSGLPSVAAIDELAPVVQQQCRQLGLVEKDLAKAVVLALEALRKVSIDPTGQWLFASSHSDVRAEWALTVRDGAGTDRRVIDRTFVTAEGTRWIIDFKTGSHSGGGLEEFLHSEVLRHGDQLRRYAEILTKVDNRPVQLGLYFPLLQQFREVTLKDGS